MATRRSTFFRDGVSRIDFILVQKKELSKELRLQNSKFFANLKKYGLKVERENGVKYDNFIFIKVHTPDDVLKQIADIHGVALLFEKDRTVPRYTNLWAMFKSPITKIPNLQDPMFMRCSESVRGEVMTTFTTAERIMLTHFVLLRTEFGQSPEECGLPKMLARRNFEDAYPLHDGRWEWEDKGPLNDRQILTRFWGNWRHFYKQQPMHIIHKYFGAEVAFYYAWLGFYTKMLVPIAVVGVLLVIGGSFSMSVFRFWPRRIDEVCNSDVDVCPLCVNTLCVPLKMNDFCKDVTMTYILDNPFTVVYAILTTIWATVFLELWYRMEYRLLYKWNLMNVRPDIDERPDFVEQTKKYLRVNPYTGLEEHYCPTRLKIKRYLISTICCALCILAVIVSVLFVIVAISILRHYMYLTDNEVLHNYCEMILRLCSGILSIIAITLFKPLVDKIALDLTNKEIHRTHREYMNSYIIKASLLSFVNTYTVILYNAFFRNINYTYPGDSLWYKQVFSIATHNCPPSVGCITEVSLYIFLIMVRSCAAMIFTETKVTARIRQKLKTIRKGNSLKWKTIFAKTRIPQWERDYELAKPIELSFLNSCLAFVLEYGMMMFFIAALPLLPLMALINNIVELRLSAITLVKHMRRNVPNRVQGLGAWNTVLTILTRISFMASGFVIAFASKSVHRWTYYSEHGSLKGFVNDTMALFLIEDFGPKTKARFEEKYPNMTTCYFSGLRNSYDHPDKYQTSDRYYQILSLQLVMVVSFAHIAFWLTQLITFVIPKKNFVIQERLFYEKRQLYANYMKNVKAEMKSDETHN